MKYSRVLVAAFLCIAGCTSIPPVDKHVSGWWLKAADGSSSPISQEQAWAIARATIAKREQWPYNERGSDGFIHSVSSKAQRINRGGWKVVARRAVSVGGPDGGCIYDPIPAAIIVINKRGAVTGYSRQFTAD